MHSGLNHGSLLQSRGYLAYLAQAQLRPRGCVRARSCDGGILGPKSERSEVRTGLEERLAHLVLERPQPTHCRKLLARAWGLLSECHDKSISWPPAAKVDTRRCMARDICHCISNSSSWLRVRALTLAACPIVDSHNSLSSCMCAK